MSAVLEARGLAVDRGRRNVLRGVDLALLPGEGVALVGPNAAGKSTLVRALAGLLSPARGEILLEGRPLASWPRSGLAQRVALVAAEDEAPDRIAVEDRVALGRYPHRGALAPLTAEDRAAVARALRQTETSSTSPGGRSGRSPPASGSSRRSRAGSRRSRPSSSSTSRRRTSTCATSSTSSASSTTCGSAASPSSP